MHLVIEVDGSIHDEQADSDTVRAEFLEANGLHVLRFANEVVLSNPQKVIDVIEEFLAGSVSP